MLRALANHSNLPDEQMDAIMRVAVSAVQEFWRRDHLEGDASRPTAQTSAAAVARAGAGTRGTTGSASTGAAKPAQEFRCKFCKRGPFENKRGLTMHQIRCLLQLLSSLADRNFPICIGGPLNGFLSALLDCFLSGEEKAG